MLRLGPQLTFLSRVLRPVVVVAVAHKLYTERRPCMVSQQQQQQKQQKQQYRTLTTTSSILHDGCFKPKCLRVGGSAFGLLSFVTLLLFLSFAESFFFWVYPHRLLLLLSLWTRLKLQLCVLCVWLLSTNQFRYRFCTKRTRQVVEVGSRLLPNQMSLHEMFCFKNVR